jgi:hypothetical protein
VRKKKNAKSPKTKKKEKFFQRRALQPEIPR